MHERPPDMGGEQLGPVHLITECMTYRLKLTYKFI